MKGVYVDVNSRTVQIIGIGIAQDFTTGDIISDRQGIVRFKNIGETDGRIRILGYDDDGVVISSGETEYFGIYPGEQIEIISGDFNVM